MLVLSRKQNQQILVGNDITITILKVRGNSVRIGIEAPKSVHVMRGELERQDDEQPVDSNLTVEFRSNGTRSVAGRPELRLVGGGDPSCDEQQPTKTNRLQQMVAELAVEQHPTQ